MLNREIFSKLCVLYPGLSIDIFATTLKGQLPRFASWRPDPRSAFVNAFSRSWHGEYLYAFPPFSLIQHCLDRVELDQAQGVLLVPAWPTQTWYTRLLQMLSGQPVVMVWTAQSDLLVHPSGPKMHNLQGRLSLMACPVSGNSIESRAFRSTSATQKQYAVYFKKWAVFCSSRQIAPCTPDLTDVLEFLHGLLRMSYSALNSARSALSCIISVNGLPVGKHSVVCRFLKEAFQQKPPSKKLHGIWDVNQVLRFLKTFQHPTVY